MAFGMTIRRALSTTSCDQRFHDFESLVNCIRTESRFTTRTPNVRKVCTGDWTPVSAGHFHPQPHATHRQPRHTARTNEPRAHRLRRTYRVPLRTLEDETSSLPPHTSSSFILPHHSLARISTLHTTLLFISVPAPLHTHIASDGLAFFEISISFPLSAPLGALVFRASCVRGREAPCQNAPQGGR